MGSRVPKDREVRVRVDTADGYEASFIADDLASLEIWLKAQLGLIEKFGAQPAQDQLKYTMGEVRPRPGEVGGAETHRAWLDDH